MARSKRSQPRDLTAGLVYDRAAWTWVTPKEMARREEIREERIFQRQLSQGELAAPMVIRDSLGIHGVQSMANGEFYDSKRAMRRHYREARVEEVGNDSSVTPEGIRSTYAKHRRPRTRDEKDTALKSAMDSVEKAISQTNLTSYRKDEIT